MRKKIKFILRLLKTKTFDKFIAVGLSLLLWLYIVSGISSVNNTSLNIIYKLPNGYVFSTEVNKKIDVQYKGVRALMDQVDRSKNIIIDLTKVKKNTKGFHTYEFGKLDFPFVDGLELINYFPKKVSFKIEKVLEKKVRVVPNLYGQVPKGLRIKKISVAPNKIFISGPKSFIKKVNSVKTELIDQSQFEQGINRYQLKLNQQDKFKTTLENLTLTAELEGLQENLTKKTLPILFLSPSFDYESNFNKVTLTLTGNPGIDLENIKAVVNISDTKRNMGKIPIKIDIPEGLTLVDYTPRFVKISKKGKGK
ncbi:MAG: hypothetical protein CME61_04535 [Halobacteriovoraceae bacterium]|nr:hypothetical protein [Halobacteriovoraceae bacterium]|tara:strand:- start:11 stop:937 length:927 start_codon:yes stop_codon:yes gene_type:complete